VEKDCTQCQWLDAQEFHGDWSVFTNYVCTNPTMEMCDTYEGDGIEIEDLTLAKKCSNFSKN
jgi:hypothetical protein